MSIIEKRKRKERKGIETDKDGNIENDRISRPKASNGQRFLCPALILVFNETIHHLFNRVCLSICQLVGQSIAIFLNKESGYKELGTQP